MSDATTVTLAAAVERNSAAARVFDRLGLDYCCHGQRSVADACAEAGLDHAEVEAELASLTVTPSPWTDLGPPQLADHIVETHHIYLHEELPLLDALADKVRNVHGDAHPELVEVSRLVTAVREDLIPHMIREENVLFPAIHAMTEGPTDFPFGSVDNPIRVMTAEHERTGELLEELRAAARDYAVPADACGSYRSLYERLEQLEADTHLHIHKENHVLFPAARRLAGA